MNPDLMLIFGADALDRFQRGVMNWMNSRLAVRASGASTEEDQKVFRRLASCLSCSIEFSGSQIKCAAGVDRDKLPSDFSEKYSGIIDSVETEFDNSNTFILETMINDEMEMPDVEARMTELVMPYIETQLSNMFGGGESA